MSELSWEQGLEALMSVGFTAEEAAEIMKEEGFAEEGEEGFYGGQG